MSAIARGSKEKHEFALHVESLSLLIHNKNSSNIVTFTDEKLFHRMVNVLRLRIGDSCIFFDRKIYSTVKIEAFAGKKQINVLIQAVQSTTVLYPHITFLLPLLKRDDLQAALYALTEMGVNSIQLIFTQKTENQWVESRDNDRAQRIIIAAAEQSKNFAYPHMHMPIPLEVALKQYDGIGVKIFFDPQGKQCFEVMETLYKNQPQDIVLLIGPEGDLSLEEKKMVQANNFIFCALTPTIMRAVQAAALAAGFVRSLLR